MVGKVALLNQKNKKNQKRSYRDLGAHVTRTRFYRSLRLAVQVTAPEGTLGVGSACRYGNVGHVTDAGQRLPAKAVGRYGVEVLKRLELTGGEPLTYNLHVFFLRNGNEGFLRLSFVLQSWSSFCIN